MHNNYSKLHTMIETKQCEHDYTQKSKVTGHLHINGLRMGLGFCNHIGLISKFHMDY